MALNTAAPMAARVIDAAFALVYLRLLGRADVGAYQFLVVFTTYVDTLVDFGLNALIAREVARGAVSARAAFTSVNAIRLGLWLVGLPVVLVVYGPARGVANLSDTDVLAGWVFYLALLPSVLAKTASGLLWAAERLELTAAVSMLSTVIKTALGAVVLLLGLGLVGLAGASFIVNLVSAAILLALSARIVAAAPAGRFGVRTWLNESWPLFINQLLQGLFFKIDAILILPLGGALVAGTYGAAYKVSEGAGIVSSYFTLALFPRLSRETDLAGRYRLALKLLLQLALPLTVGIALLSEPIVALVGGTQYLPDSAIALAILIWYLPLSYVNGLTQYVLIAAGRQRLLTGAFVAALVFNVGANLLLIPKYGFVGAALVTVLSEVVLLVPFQLVAAQVAPGVRILPELPPAVLATALMAPVVWWVRDAVHPIAAIAAGAAVYPLALWALRGIDAEQWALLSALLPRAVTVWSVRRLRL